LWARNIREGVVMSKVKGSNIFTNQIAEFLEVPLSEAIKIQDYIDQWLDLDWSEASNLEIEITAQVAQQLMKGESNA
jgi:hypothetical protein